MPDTTTFGLDPIPTGAEGAYVPGDLMAYAESIDPKLVHSVADLAERDARFASLPAGHLVCCPGLKTVWLSLTGVGAWDVVYMDSGWKPLTASMFNTALWTGSGSARYRRLNKLVDVFVLATYIGSPVTAPAAGGGITHIEVATIPTEARPSTSFGGAFWGTTPGFAYLNAAGVLVVTHLASGGTLATNAALNFHSSYALP